MSDTLVPIEEVSGGSGHNGRGSKCEEHTVKIALIEHSLGTISEIKESVESLHCKLDNMKECTAKQDVKLKVLWYLFFGVVFTAIVAKLVLPFLGL